VARTGLESLFQFNQFTDVVREDRPECSVSVSPAHHRVPRGMLAGGLHHTSCVRLPAVLVTLPG
jgi:hypothetical protein